MSINPVGAGYVGHLMRPAHTHGSALRVDLVVGPSVSSGRQVVGRARAVVPAPRRGAGGDRCNGQRTRPVQPAAAGLPRSASGPAPPAEPCPPTAPHRHSPAAPAQLTVAVPSQQRGRLHQPSLPHPAGQQPRQPSQHRTLSPIQSGSGHPPAQHRNLVAQQQELGILGCRTSRQQRKPPHQLAEHQVHQSQGHPPIIATR